MNERFTITGKVAVLTGASGVLVSAMARYLAEQGVCVALLDLRRKEAELEAKAINDQGGQALALQASVLDKAELEAAAAQVAERWGRIDILVNGAGGNRPEATTGADRSFFELDADALRGVMDLNLMGTVLPSQVFGKVMAGAREGAIVNISSMNAFRPLTRIAGYSAAKAAINNFTQWLAVHLAQECAPDIRVNAIAPGFFETTQNRYLLREESGEATPRGRQILQHTPQGRFGEPDDLLGALHWLVSPAARFVTGIVVPVDGGFSAYSGV